ncbi:MAG TPA: T9SS type A sorting domain-containing protein [Saprospiraceae bacterium]|nr:T9SS type A sorting domain-containing protein [Saprospiraceae bacterium]
MKQILISACFFFVLTVLHAQREHVNSERLRFKIKDASFLDSYDGRIVPKFSGGFKCCTYKWTGPDNFISTDSMLVNIKPGTYVVRMNDGKCSFFNDTIHVISRSNTYQTQKSFVVSRVHPNPFAEEVEIQLRSNIVQTVQLEIFYSNGQVYARKHISLDEGETNFRLDLGTAPSGIYVLNFCNSSNCKMTERIIKLN